MTRCVCIGLAASAVTAIYARPQRDHSAAIHPIIDKDGELLGATRAGRWIPQDKAAHLLRGGETYRLYSASSSMGIVRGGKPVSMDAPCPDQMTVSVKMPEKAIVGVNGSWDAMPRKARVESASQPVYRAAVKKVLEENGIRNPDVRIDQIFRCDLDNDGADEVLISAHRYSARDGNHDPHAGDYSFIMLRKLKAGRVTTSVVAGEFYPKHKTEVAPNTCRIDGFYDFMGDKKMQIVVGWQYYEGSGSDVYTVRGDGRTDVVLSSACGA